MANRLKLGLVGVGNMGTAIVRGVLAKGVSTAGTVWIYDKIKDKSGMFAAQQGVHQCASIEEVFKNAEVILLAIKPQDFNDFANQAKCFSKSGQLIISILAGKKIETLKNAFGSQVKWVRVMPNLGAEVGQSMSVLAGTDSGALQTAESLFAACGKTLVLDEKFFDLVTAVSGSGPAYFFLLMEILAEYAVRAGLSRDQAKILASQTALGSAGLASQSSDMPGALREKVTSKGGTTQAALDVLESKKIREAFIQALDEAQKRSKELSL